MSRLGVSCAFCLAFSCGVPGTVARQDDDLQDSGQEVRHEDHPEGATGAVLGVLVDVLHALEEGHDQAHDDAGTLRPAEVSCCVTEDANPSRDTRLPPDL